MKQQKSLRTKTNMKSVAEGKTAICGVEVYQKSDGHTEVILTQPEGIEYKGVSTTNYFENFATKIKSELLGDTPHHLIIWKDRLTFHDPSYPNHDAMVLMDYDGKFYSNPQWVKG